MLGGPAMHIFSGLAHFGQMCTSEGKSAVPPIEALFARLLSVAWMP
jgi:hypothetical protein